MLKWQMYNEPLYSAAFAIPDAFVTTTWYFLYKAILNRNLHKPCLPAQVGDLAKWYQAMPALQNAAISSSFLPSEVQPWF